METDEVRSLTKPVCRLYFMVQIGVDIVHEAEEKEETLIFYNNVNLIKKTLLIWCSTGSHLPLPILFSSFTTKGKKGISQH